MRRRQPSVVPFRIYAAQLIRTLAFNLCIFIFYCHQRCFHFVAISNAIRRQNRHTIYLYMRRIIQNRRANYAAANVEFYLTHLDRRFSIKIYCPASGQIILLFIFEIWSQWPGHHILRLWSALWMRFLFWYYGWYGCQPYHWSIIHLHEIVVPSI